MNSLSRQGIVIQNIFFIHKEPNKQKYCMKLKRMPNLSAKVNDTDLILCPTVDLVFRELKSTEAGTKFFIYLKTEFCNFQGGIIFMHLHSW